MSHGYDERDLVDEVVVVLLAAGAGKRLGSSRPKAFVALAGKVILAHALQCFEDHPAVDSIVIVAPPDWEGPTEVLVDDLGCDRVTSIETGGETRGESVACGLAAVRQRRQTAVLVHDAARPVVPAGVIDRVLAPLADGYDAAIPALPVADAVKRVARDGAVVETLPRSELRLVQTPQCCRSTSLHHAIERLSRDQLAATADCAEAIEAAGGKVTTVRGDSLCHKITTADDLRLVEQRVTSQSAKAGNDG